ncbi:uncharacterized protein LOC126780565 isoform X2 [Nymphalis io]|uniref:uncharacterized protein LOC126780565 isoform X2 n=1 Tax=Inachis io TaxID=171585 RepID=UPI002169FFAB|nr:uncharacterized protein LOC126780565 isoform X2 [Nymphalis io]
MIEPEENKKTAVQPVDTNLAKDTEEVDPTMDCEEHKVEEELVGPITGTPYDEDFYDEREDEEPEEWTSPPPSPVPPIAFGVDDEYEEDGCDEEHVSDLAYGLDNSFFMQAIDQSNTETNNKMHLLGVYKCVYLTPKDEQDATENEQESEIIEKNAQ